MGLSVIKVLRRLVIERALQTTQNPGQTTMSPLPVQPLVVVHGGTSVRDRPYDQGQDKG